MDECQIDECLKQFKKMGANEAQLIHEETRLREDAIYRLEWIDKLNKE